MAGFLKGTQTLSDSRGKFCRVVLNNAAPERCALAHKAVAVLRKIQEVPLSLDVTLDLLAQCSGVGIAVGCCG